VSALFPEMNDDQCVKQEAPAKKIGSDLFDLDLDLHRIGERVIDG
jgi:hypothetical protein